MKKSYLLIAAVSITLFMGCGDDKSGKDGQGTQQENDQEQNDGQINDSTALVLKGKTITLREVVGSPTFPESKFSIASPAEGDILDAGDVTFGFNVEGGTYELGGQTSDAENKTCANSAKGQHVHLILNNEPYSAAYESEFTKELNDGNYLALAFISRSYHESLKHDGAAALVQFQVGEVEDADPIDLAAPHLFYSRPKGEYNVTDAPDVFLDFYLVNTEISEGGNYVKATINGEEFKITKWAPYYMDGLTAGEHTIKIQLFDKDDNYIEGPFNTEERTITLVN